MEIKMSEIMLSAFADEYDASFEEQLKGLCGFGIGNNIPPT